LFYSFIHIFLEKEAEMAEKVLPTEEAFGASLKAIKEAQASSAAATSSKLNPGSAKPAKPKRVRSTAGGGGGSSQPPANSGGGGGGGFRGWWDGLDLWVKIGLLLALGFALSFTTNTWSMYWNDKVSADEARITKRNAEAELAVAEIKAKTAEAKAKESLVSGGIQSTKNQTILRVTEPPSTFDCSTVEKMKANFITERTIEGEQGTQLLLKGGCAKVRFNHKITFLEGDGYLVTFDSMEDPNPHMCGNGHGRRNDPPETCIKLLNEHEGETFFVGNKESNSYVKIGG
jgi:hypothetical protein